MSKKSVVAAAVISASVAAIVSWGARGIYDIYIHKNIYTKVSSIETLLNDAYLYDYDAEQLADNAALGMIMTLEDPYTMYYSRREFTDYMNNFQGDFIGIGVVVVLNKEDNTIEVTSVLDNSPGMEAGILPGDIITAVNGETFSGTELNEVLSKIKGTDLPSPENTSVNITVLRDGKPIDLTLVRRRIHQKTITCELKSNDIGLIRISAFNTESESGEKSTDVEFIAALDELTKQGMKKLIIDVRDNGGGDLDAVAGIIDRIVPEGLIMYSEDKFGNRDELTSDETELDMPAVVLVNGNSASASELLTGALKDHGKATVIGTTTYGKGVMQTIVPFSDGSGMTLTIAKYYTPAGICVHDTGITPDIISEQSEKHKATPVTSIPENEDLQLQAAIDYLKTK